MLTILPSNLWPTKSSRKKNKPLRYPYRYLLHHPYPSYAPKNPHQACPVHLSAVRTLSTSPPTTKCPYQSITPTKAPSTHPSQPSCQPLPSLGFPFRLPLQELEGAKHTFQMEQNVVLVVLEHLRHDFDVHVLDVDVLRAWARAAGIG